MAISSNTLFHFTNEFKYLKQSIEEGLWPRYCVEKKWNGKDFAIPMLCFCDIPLSQVKEHIGGYGCYGIGVTKNFARNNKITPVTYLHQGSLLYNKLDYFISKFQTPSTNHKKMDFKELMLYQIKKVCGFNNSSEPRLKFYNEREWRYIPPISENVHLEILPGTYSEKEMVDKYSARTENDKIPISAEDIAYIIVKEEGEIKKMIKILKKRYDSYDYLESLYSRIITVTQIRNDF